MLQPQPSNKTVQKQKFTAQMQMDLHVLHIPLFKLINLANQQVEENPCLELDKPESGNDVEQIEEYLSLGRDERADTNHNFNDLEAGSNDQQEYLANIVQAPQTLQDYLLRQLYSLESESLQYEIGEYIIGNIDVDGYLTCSIDDIVQETKADQRDVEMVLYAIQAFDPVGVGARDLKECLLLQLNAKGQVDSLAYRMVNQCMGYLEQKQYGPIAKEMGVSSEEVEGAVKEITALEPKPGRAYNIEKIAFVIPDASLEKRDEGFELVMNAKEVPRLRLNEDYREMIKSKSVTGEALEYLRERIGAARFFMTALERRQQTTRDVIEAIIAIQKDFFDEKTEVPVPMTLEDVAQKTGKSKSTVSRTIQNKYLQTAQGVIGLKYFFNSAVNQGAAVDTTAEAIKIKINDLIEEENKQKPLSDQKIVEKLKSDGITISRRAVTKYREQLGIGSSQARRT